MPCGRILQSLVLFYVAHNIDNHPNVFIFIVLDFRDQLTNFSKRVTKVKTVMKVPQSLFYQTFPIFLCYY